MRRSGRTPPGVARGRRLPTILLSGGVVVAVVVAMLIVGGASSPAVAFQQTGHWVFNRAESSVVHVDSGTRQVDARVLVPGVGADPVFALQGEQLGFLVGRRSITVFGKSTLTVESTIPTGQPEMPVGIEVAGGPYLVYQQAGTIVRLGEPPLSIPVGGSVGRPVYTDDGTVWLHRLDNGALCALRRGADRLDCSLQTAAGSPGALTVTSSTPAFLDTAQDALQTIEAAALRPPLGVGTDLPDAALIGDRDTEGRLPAVLTGPNRLVLADTSGVPVRRAGGPAIPVDLGDGQFSSPVAAGGVVAVIEVTRNRLLTFGIDGRPLGAVDLPPGGGPASMVRGADGQIYVDDADGAVTRIVGRDGKVTSIKTGGIVTAVVAPPPDRSAPIPPPPRRDPTPPVTGPVTLQPGTQPVQLPSPPPVPSPAVPIPPPVDPLPAAPTGVAAVARPDGSVGVTWNAVAGGGVQVRYTILTSDGSSLGSTSASVTFRGLRPGGTYTFVVTATTTGGTGAASDPSNAVVVPVGPPGAPLNVTIAENGEGARTGVLDVTWQRPALNGGELVEYAVTATDSTGRQVLNTTSTTESIPTFRNDFCLSPYRFTIRAVTRTPGTTGTVTGPPAVASSKPYDCSWAMAISAQATGPQSASVKITQTNGVFPYASGPCSLLFNGSTRWTGTCGGTKTPTAPVIVTGLAPSTSYQIVLRATQVDGSVTSSNTVSLTTPA